jgi:1-acyl-sn-glycerol-3-phosphate acyltransferase
MEGPAQEPSAVSAGPVSAATAGLAASVAIPSPRPAAGPGVSWRPGFAPLTAPLPYLRRPAARLLCRGLMLTLGQMIEVERGERLAAVPEPAIFALNHRYALEALLAPTVLIYLRRGAPLHFLADWMYVEAPGLGWLLRQSEPIAVYRKPARFRLRESHRRERLRRPVLDACRELLGRGESIGIFPEGTRNRDGRRLLRGRLGLGELALAAAVPVVPVAIRYLHRETTREPRRALDRPRGWGRMVLAIGEPLDFAAERRQLAEAATSNQGDGRPPSEPRSDLRRELARRVVDRVMAALAGALGSDYRPWHADPRPVPRPEAGGPSPHLTPTPDRTAEAPCE